MSARPVRVLVLLQRPEAWVNLASVWAAMQADPGIAPTLWLLPYNASDPATSARKAPLARRTLDAAGIPYVEWQPSMVLAAGDFDVALLNHPYDRERPPALWFSRIAAAVPATAYLPYGLAMGGGWKNLRMQFAQPTQRGATAVIARSPAERAAYARHCPTGDSHVHVLGHPRFDHLLQSLGHADVAGLARWAAGRIVVLWNAHFSFGPEHSQGSNFSTFDLLGPELLEAIRRRRDRMCLLWRPHPGLMPALARLGLLDEAERPALRAELLSIGVMLDEDADHAPAFQASDALLTDAGSFLVEYLAMRRPMLALVNPEGEPPNEEAAALRREIGAACTPTEVEAFLDALLDGRAAAPAQAVLARHLPALDGRAGARVAALLKALAGTDPAPSGIDRGDATLATAAAKPRTPTDAIAIDASPSTPILDRLMQALVAIRTAKRAEPGWRKALRRAYKRASGLALEAFKQSPQLLAIVQRARGLQ